MANQYRNQQNITDWDQVPVVFDVPMAARILAMTDQKIRKMCREGDLPAFKVGENSWRFNKEAFMEFLGAIKNSGSNRQ
ncbi:MAG: helix-turn-helix domain-containing protein [Ruminiclostridium sp.]|uniref:helix-turn-helix domain-containing protein n=1 Tax=Ruminococcus sp. TaxID=41978 RepID=UPI0025E678B2|nr:helix-turn-helix domain-containing protein [Ruminococcus sp.]MBR1433043.1 helix-turn-helix domain-containing protein [Ruminococcus sp.]MBR1831051.1 helix-turn-helix domain-containing protein [Ruminiclostridium sp.]